MTATALCHPIIRVVYLYRGHRISLGSPLMLQDPIEYIDNLHLRVTLHRVIVWCMHMHLFVVPNARVKSIPMALYM